MLSHGGLTLVGLVVLVGGAEFMIRGAVGVARRLGVSTLVVGLTVIAFGTSLPELVVSLRAALSGSAGLAVGNIVGSNVANILLILGAAVAIASVRFSRITLYRDGGAMLAATLFFAGAGLTGGYGWAYGAVALTATLGYLIYSYRSDRNRGGAESEREHLPGPLALTLAALLGGLVGVGLGADLLVRGATGFARELGVSEEVIGLTLVAFGTSVPELATTVVAAVRRHADIALGNVIGSNIFNLLMVIGVTGLIIPIGLPPEIARFDLWIMLGITLGLLAFMAVSTRIPRPVGVLFLLAYGGFIAVQVG